MPHLVVLGNTVADVLVHPIDRFPEPGLSLHVEGARLTFGGCGANTANTAAKLGAPTRLCSAIGDDEIGRFVLTQLARNPRLDVSGVATLGGVETSVTLVLIHPANERSFICHSAASSRLEPAMLPEDFLEGAGILHYAGFFLFPHLLGKTAAGIFQRARAGGVVTSLDVAWKEGLDWTAAIRPCLPHLDYVMPNVDEACRVSRQSTPEDAAAWFLSGGVGTVLITLGEAGVLWATAEGQSGRMPAISLPVVDTTGAGDAFAGAFLAATLASRTEPRFAPLESRLRFASAAGALACTAIGGADGLVSAEQVEKLVEGRI
ncbi:MAG: carbohydrate kinase family protein [Candidatus Wallbacteria bacterium]|nr:carbohydrate kinase family protein [Candidatus Wallbacteria bacterium]